MGFGVYGFRVFETHAIAAMTNVAVTALVFV